MRKGAVGRGGCSGGLGHRPALNDTGRHCGTSRAGLVCHGADDSFIPAQAIQAFRDALDKGHVKYEFVSYPGAVHSFTVADADKHGLAGMKYDKSADEDSWKRMRALFSEKFGK